MASSAIADRRLFNQGLTRTGFRTAVDVVAWHGAVQAQEYEPAKWGVGLRMRDGAIDADVEAAIESGAILRTHVLRPTWHFVAASDIRWLLELTGPRLHERLAPYDRKLELDAKTYIARTAQPVVLSRGNARIEAQGLSADLKQDRITLESGHGRLN